MANGNGRQPPWSEEAEISVLGAMLIDEEAARDGRDLLQADHFYRESHRRIFRALSRIVERGDVPDVTLLSDELKSAGELEAAGGVGALAQLVDAVPTAANLESHAEILQRKAALRQLIRGAGESVREAYDAPTADAEAVLDRAESRILSASRALTNGASDAHGASGLVSGFLDRVEEARQSPGGVTGLPTGFADLDRMTRGLDPGTLTVVAGRPSMGKTALELDVARHVSLRQGAHVGIASLEMPAETVIGRMICQEGGLDYQRTVTGRLKDRDAESLAEAAGRLKTAPLTVSSPATLNLYQLRRWARKLHRRHDLGLLTVDYLQLMDGPSDAGNREQEVARLSRGLKSIALELGVPVMALSQLSRAPENRPGSNRPRLSDLRESGAIEQDADLVLFVYREAMYVDPTDARYSEVENEAEIIVGKHRNGPTGTVRLWFRRSEIRFESKVREGRETLL